VSVADRVGQQLGNYRLIQLLGQGNFASVYLGEHIHLNTQAAIKVLHGRLASIEREAFLTEARTVARLRHPHIVQVLDYGVEDTSPFLVMEYAPGGNLRQRHPEGTKLPLDTIVSYVKQVADALQYAHQENVVHRDIKPENMLLGRNDEILLSDFGIAVMIQNTLQQPAQNPAGTIAYMAPEQIRAQASPASDQYALAVVVYEWLCGERPFHGSYPEIAIKHTVTSPPALREKIPDISPAIEHMVLTALAKDPQQRFPSVEAFAQALEEAGKAMASGQTLPVPNLPSNFPPLKAQFNNLPGQLTSLIGREQELATLCSLLQRADVRLVTLTGTGGIGKTRLGLQIAADLLDSFADGVCFVPLAPVSDSTLVMHTIIHTLGLEHQELRLHLSKNDTDYLKTFFGDKHFLLVLDNFEQVVTAAPELIDLLTACPNLKILVTSRAVLHVQGEHEFTVPPLALPKRVQPLADEDLSNYAAVALFLERALAIKPDLAITKANVHAIAAICRHLDGLPLAIELAAARIKLLPPQALLQRLTHRLAVLTSGTQNVPERQQTLRNTIEWSYHLLDAVERQLFRRISVFVGGCTLEAIEAIYMMFADIGAEQVLDGVASLIDKSLLQQIEQEDEQPRLVMLETIREYGLERLNANGEEEMTRQAHASYYLALAEEAEPTFGSPQQAVWLGKLERENDNLRAALRWSVEPGATQQRIEIGLRLGGALRRFWIVRGYWSEGLSSLEQALAISDEVPASVRAKAFIAAANMAVNLSDANRAETLCQKSLALCREIGDRPGIAYTLYLLSWANRIKEDFATARSYAEESLALFRELDDKENIVWSLYALAALDSIQGEYTRADTLFEECLALFRERGNKIGLAWTLYHLAQTRMESHAVPTLVRGLLEESLALWRELGDPRGTAYAIFLSGQVALNQFDVETAHSLAQESVQLYKELGDREGRVKALILLARVATFEGNRTMARSMYEQALAIARETNQKWMMASCLEGLASIIVLQAEVGILDENMSAGNQVTRWAAQLWGAANALREEAGIPIPFVERADYEHSVSAVRSQLGDETFIAAWTQGRSMTPEQAIEARGREAAMAANTLPAVPATATETPASSNPAGLTAREIEVLRLVAQGMTNTEIAQNLKLSEKTVAHHLTHIFNKTTSENRAAAAAFAIRHGLA
jgi:predicted ATPase/DNA-binding CsgD family transcriptional regulator